MVVKKTSLEIGWERELLATAIFKEQAWFGPNQLHIF